MSNHSSSFNTNSAPKFKCHCKRVLPLKTAWSKSNPGRRYYDCPDNRNERFCGWFNWWDIEVDERSKIIIPNLFKQRNALKAELDSYKEKEKDLEEMVNGLRVMTKELEMKYKELEKRIKKTQKKVEKYKKTRKVLLVVLGFVIDFIVIIVMKMTNGRGDAYMQLN